MLMSCRCHVFRERDRRAWEASEEVRVAREAAEAERREAHRAAIKELSAQTQVNRGGAVWRPGERVGGWPEGEVVRRGACL